MQLWSLLTILQVVEIWRTDNISQNLCPTARIFIYLFYFWNNKSPFPLHTALDSEAALLGCLGHLSLSSSPLSAPYNCSQHAESFNWITDRKTGDLLHAASLKSQKCDVKGMVLRIHENALLCHLNWYLLYIIRALKRIFPKKSCEYIFNCFPHYLLHNFLCIRMTQLLFWLTVHSCNSSISIMFIYLFLK